MYSLSHCWRKARLKPADPVLGYRWHPLGHHGPSVTGRQPVRAEGVSNSRLRPTCYRSLCGYLAPLYCEELFQLTVGACFGYCRPKPKTAKGSARCCAGPSQALLHPSPPQSWCYAVTGREQAQGQHREWQRLRRAMQPGLTPPLPVPHTRSSPASFC